MFVEDVFESTGMAVPSLHTSNCFVNFDYAAMLRAQMFCSLICPQLGLESKNQTFVHVT